MRLVRTTAELRAELEPARRSGRSIGLVPTMGALHDGHLALLAAARERCDVVVMSLFVNPTQFRPDEDLAAYPRDEARDAELAAAAGVDVVYAPAADDVYPPGFATSIEVSGGLVDVLDGDPARRGPEHFRGVATVVAKLFNAVGPDIGVLRPEGRAAGDRDPADGARPRLPGRDRGRPDRARGRRAGDELAQPLPRGGPTASARWP